MTSRQDQLRATALLWLIENTDTGQRFSASLDLGKRYRAAQRFYGRYDSRSIDWYFARNLDRRAKAWRAVAHWWPDEGPAPTGILLLSGGQGTTKTTAAVGLLLRQGGEFVRAADIQEIGLGEAGEATLERLRNPRLLVLDNLGAEKDIGPTITRIRGLIIHLDGLRRPIVITTTLAPFCTDKHGRPIPGVDPDSTIEGRYDYDVVDRILGDGAIVDIEEPSRRNPRIRPDVSEAEASAQLFDLLGEVEQVKRGAGDPKTIRRLAEAAGISSGQIEAASAEAERSMREALSNLPPFLSDHPTFQRYRDRWGVAPAES